ncbi:hypothetical protein [Ferrovibrio sp.]|uniref:hypothetical protein n=1 Tax=Ferrovibrio sp. TaxID=1917215 RepID=UPI002626A57C|nr:hypothetical protein [Ferrovibrio sp.]
MTTMTMDQIREFASTHTVTPAERRARRVSLITGVLSEKTTLTKDKVESVLNHLEGNLPEVDQNQK